MGEDGLRAINAPVSKQAKSSPPGVPYVGRTMFRYVPAERPVRGESGFSASVRIVSNVFITLAPPCGSAAGCLKGANRLNIVIRKYQAGDLAEMIVLWNEVVAEGIAFPQEEPLDAESAACYFAGQSHCGVAENRDTGTILGLYTLHPNNVGRCGHICNASYAVSAESRGLHIGEKLVLDCVAQAGACGFRILQFNAVVETNVHARHLYERLGFIQLGVIPGGFRMKDGHYEAICPYYLSLNALPAK